MSIVRQEWYNVNEDRNYPLDDNATAISTTDVQLPNNILVDANVLFPRSIGRFLYVSSVAVSTHVVSVTFLATSGAPGEVFTPVASLSVVDAEPYRNYSIDALVPGVAGWVVFGLGVKQHEALSLAFSGTTGTRMVPRAAKPYGLFPVTSLGKLRSLPTLQGEVMLKGTEGNVTVTRGARVLTYDDREETRSCILIGLDTSEDAKVIMRDFAGPCGARLNSHNCANTPLVTINGVEPDKHGNIVLSFGPPLLPHPIRNGGGIILDYPVGLSDVCPHDKWLPDEDGNLPFEPGDLCNDTPAPPTPTPPEPTPEETPGPAPTFTPPPATPTPAVEITPTPTPPPSQSPLLEHVCAMFNTGAADDFVASPLSWLFYGTPGSKWLRANPYPSAQQDVYQRFDTIQVGKSTTLLTRSRVLTQGGNALILFSHVNSANLWFAGYSLNTTLVGTDLCQMVFIGRKYAGSESWPAGLGYGYNFVTAITVPDQTFQLGRDYRLRLELIPTLGYTAMRDIAFYVYDPANNDALIAATSLAGQPLNSGLVGMGLVSGSAEFYSFGANCDNWVLAP